MSKTIWNVGDRARYIGPNGFFPVDSHLAMHYLELGQEYAVSHVGANTGWYTELKLEGVQDIPFVSVIFEKV